MTNLEGLHQLVHVLLNIVSVLNTILLAIDALFPSARSSPLARKDSDTNGSARG